MHVRILMGSCNGAAWLQMQLDSFLAQTHTDWSLWVSDDHSDDETRAILIKFGKDNPGRLAHVLTGPGRGSAANFMSLLCHPDLPAGTVALSDQDDVWNSEKLAQGILHLPDNGVPAGYAARYVIADADLSPRKVSRQWLRGPSFGNALVQNIMSGHTTMLNAPALALVRAAGPQDIPHHDWWLYQLLSGAGAELYLDDAVVLKYRQHGSNVFGTRSGVRAILARLKMLNNHKYTGWVQANRTALSSVSELLTPQARQVLMAFNEVPMLPAYRRLPVLVSAGIKRQTIKETALIYMAAVFGRI